MEFRQLEVFAAVAELKSFSKAADRLYLSQSTVSSHLKNLEKEMGKKLVLRTTKSLQLTDDGEKFLGYARRMIETRDAALEALEQDTKFTLRMGASTIPSTYLLPRLLAGFRRLHPGLRFRIRQGDSGEIQEQVLDGTIELGFLGKETESPRCTCLPVCQDELVLVTPATRFYRMLQQEKADIRRILQCPMIVREQGSGTWDAANELLDSLGISQNVLDIIIQTNDMESIKLMIADGLGVSICSRFAVQDLEAQGKVISYPLPGGARRSFFILYRNNRQLPPILQEFVQYTLEQVNYTHR